MIGAAMITEAAATPGMSVVYLYWKKASPSGAVWWDSWEIITSGSRNSFHVHMKVITTIVSTAGHPNGSSTRQSVWNVDAPSMRDASIRERGTERKNARIQKMPNGSEKPICGRIRLQYVSVSPSDRKSK